MNAEILSMFEEREKTITDKYEEVLSVSHEISYFPDEGSTQMTRKVTFSKDDHWYDHCKKHNMDCSNDIVAVNIMLNSSDAVLDAYMKRRTCA